MVMDGIDGVCVEDSQRGSCPQESYLSTVRFRRRGNVGGLPYAGDRGPEADPRSPGQSAKIA